MFDETFKIDKKFINELHCRLIKAVKNPHGVPLERKYFRKEEIPSTKQLAEIISNLIWASTQLEEGRLTRFRVGYTRGLALDHLGLLFDFPVSWNVEEIRKLAPAVRPPDGQICVYPFLPGIEDLVICGLQTTNLQSVTFEVIEPARIVVRGLLNTVVAEITGQRSGFIDSNWSRKVGDLFAVRELKEKIPQLNDLLHILHSDFTRAILSRIRQLRHGGTLVFTADEKSWKRLVERQKYESMSQFKYNGIKRVEQSLIEEMVSELQEKTKTTEEARSQFVETGINLLASDRYKTFMNNAARSVAYLTAVDGAAILDKNYNVLAFGAKIKETQKVGRNQTVVKVLPLESDSHPKESPLTHEFRGKRHLSAARFVLNNPDSLVFTVSQDGGITCFVMEDQKLMAYKGVELLL
jgi:hypothetical protein